MSGAALASLADIERDPVTVIMAVRAAVPALCWQGYGEHFRDGVPSFKADRERMTSPWCVGQFIRAAQWLDQAPRRVTLNRHATSYGWKHRAEKWHRARIADGSDYYVSSGMLLAAAYALGFRVAPCARVGHGWLNLSAKARLIGAGGRP